MFALLVMKSAFLVSLVFLKLDFSPETRGIYSHTCEGAMRMLGRESGSQESLSISSSWKLLWGGDVDRQASPSPFSPNTLSIPFCAHRKDREVSRIGTPALPGASFLSGKVENREVGILANEQCSEEDLTGD